MADDGRSKHFVSPSVFRLEEDSSTFAISDGTTYYTGNLGSENGFATVVNYASGTDTSYASASNILTSAVATSQAPRPQASYTSAANIKSA